VKVVIGGGGTAGHVFPALAVARTLSDRFDAEVSFVGTERGLEATVVPAAGAGPWSRRQTSSWGWVDT
jgi:UDP-N-acetylglucosamine--N-acetylmuramyl-(pentapeptide) pyrophosphoryl-undecaprenol N-acetylglucosamine transferase